MRVSANETINIALRDHQQSIEEWKFSEVATDLHRWAERMTLEFKLEITVPPALMLEHLRRRLGHYRRGRNAFGLRDELAIDLEHLQTDSYWQVLGTLLHELLHSWQEHNGRPPSLKSHNYHNKELRNKALSLGLIVDAQGHTQYAPGDTPFLSILQKYGVEVPEIREMPEPVRVHKGKSKLTLYECPCGVKVRVGRSKFRAMCLDCDGLFKRGP